MGREPDVVDQLSRAAGDPCRITHLPKWAQYRLADLERRLQEAETKAARLEEALPVTQQSMEWFALPTVAESRTLYLLDKDQPLKVCSLKVGDSLFIGRAKQD